MKNSTNNYTTLISNDGKIETSTYLLTDDQEMLLLKFNVFGTGKFHNETNSITSIVIRNRGLVERIIIDELAHTGMINLLKGVVNLMSLDELRENKIESDISGECFVQYQSINENLILKEKTECNETIILSSIDKEVDSFSMYKDSKIDTYYGFNVEGVLTSIKSIETHTLEPVLFQDLIQEYKSSTTIIFKKLTKSRSLIGSVTLDNVIRITFGNSYREVYLISTPEIIQFGMESDEKILKQIQKLINSKKIKNQRSKITLDLVNLFRKITNNSVMTKLISKPYSKIIKEIINDVAISCGTKICSDMILIEFDKCIKLDKSEALRILLLMQNIRIPNFFLVKQLWPKINNLTDSLFDQAIQTISSLLEISRDSSYLESVNIEFADLIKNKISSCDNDQCLSVLLSAIKNSRMEVFRTHLIKFLVNSGNFSTKIVADAVNTIWVLRFKKDNEIDIKNQMFQLIENKINFFDPYLQYQCIYSLIMLQTNTEKLVSILDNLHNNNTHYQYFLIKKLKELISFGVIRDHDILLESQFFKNSQHLLLTYSEFDGSKMLVKPLFTTDNSLMDIHFNIIGSDGGIVKHSITDLFLVSTAQENNVFSLSTHMSGMQSITGGSTADADEAVEGSLQLSLFGKQARPIILFQGYTELMSAVWNAPSELKSVLRGTFVPIDSQNEIHFQNGIVLVSNYMGSILLDFSFKLSSSIWYKTASSLLRTTGNVYVKMKSKIKSLSKTANIDRDVSVKMGIDFETNMDFGSTPIKNCMIISRPLSKMVLKSSFNTNRNKNETKYFIKNMELNGLSYSITNKMDQICTEF